MPCFRAAVASGSSDRPLGLVARACGWQVLLWAASAPGGCCFSAGSQNFVTHPARNSRRVGDWLWSLEQLLGDGTCSNLTSSRKPSGVTQPGAPFPSPRELFLKFLLEHLTLSFCGLLPARLAVCALCLVAESYLTLRDPTDCSLSGSSVCGILQARILEWVVMSFSRGSSQPRDRTQVSRIAGSFFMV